MADKEERFEIENELAQLAWAKDVPAPVDADGKVVPLATKMMYDDDGEECRIDGFKLSLDPSASSTWWAGYVVVGFDTGGYVKDLHLRRPDSWERLEEDVARYGDKLTACAYYGRPTAKCGGCPAGDVKGCDSIAACDILCRAKALAKREANRFAPQASPHGAKEADRD